MRTMLKPQDDILLYTSLRMGMTEASCADAAREVRGMMNLPGDNDEEPNEAGPLLGVPLEAGVERRSWTAGAEAHRMDRGGGGAKPPQTAPTTF